MPFSEIIQTCVIGGFILLVLVLFYQEKQAKIVPAPTLPWVKRKVLSLFKTYLPADYNGKIAELGCGWGGLTITLARAYPHAEIHGYEISFIPYLFSKIRALPFGGRVKISRTDFFKEDLATYQAIYCYLSPYLMATLKPHLEKCETGTLIVSNAFAIPDWVPIHRDQTTWGVTIPIYCYKT